MDSLAIGPGDHFEVAADADGYLAIRIEQRAFVEEPRWITFSGESYDDATRIRDLADTLHHLAGQIVRRRALRAAEEADR